MIWSGDQSVVSDRGASVLVRALITKWAPMEL